MMRRPPSRRTAADESGAIAIMAAVLTLAVVVATSLAVDVGRVAYTSRDQQGVTDRAALDGLRAVERSAEATLAGLHVDAVDAVVDSMGRNPGTDGGTARDRALTVVQLGRVTGTAFEAICDDAPETAAPSCGDVDGTGAFTPQDVDAIRVDTESFVPFVLALGDDTGGRDVRKSAVASSEATAQITVGSQLASLSASDGALLDQLMSGMLCPALDEAAALDPASTGSPTCDLGLGVVGWQGLADADVTVGDLVDAPGVSAGSPEQLVDSQVRLVDLIDAAIAGLDSAGSPATVALEGIRASVDPDAQVRMGDVIGVEAGRVDQVLESELNLLDVVRSSAFVVNGTNLVDLDLALPGLGELRLGVVEAPQTSTIGKPGVSAETGQVRLAIEVSAPVTIPVIDVGTTVDLPLYVEIGGGRAQLAAIDCGPGPVVDPTQSLTSTRVDASSSVAHVTVGELLDEAAVLRGEQDLTASNPVVAVDVTASLLAEVQVTALADTPVGSSGTEQLTFQGPYPTDWQTVSGSSLGLGEVLLGGAPLHAGGAMTFGGTVNVLSGLLSLDLDTVVGAVTGALGPLLTGTVDPLVEQLARLLGLDLGSADVRTGRVDCGQPVLMPLQDPGIPAPTVPPSP